MKKTPLTLSALLILFSGALISEGKFDQELFCMSLNPYLKDSYINFNESESFAWVMTTEKFESGTWEKYKKINQPDRWILENNPGPVLQRRWIIQKKETKKEVFNIVSYALSINQKPLERIDTGSTCSADEFIKLVLKETKKEMMNNSKEQEK